MAERHKDLSHRAFLPLRPDQSPVPSIPTNSPAASPWGRSRPSWKPRDPELALSQLRRYWLARALTEPLVQQRGVALGMAFLDGTTIRARQKAAGADKKGADSE